jgi:hypothetical protein
MATDLDLANSALNMLGEDGLVTPGNTVNNKVIPVVNRYLPMAKEETLRARDWNCVRGRAALASLTTDKSMGEWQYSYRLPNDCLCVRRFVGDTNFTRGRSFSVEVDNDNKRVIFCDVAQAQIVYTRNITNPELWDSQLFNTVACRLAWHLTGPIVRDYKLADMFLQKFQLAFEEAIASDEGEGNIEILTNSPLVDVRF